MNTPSTFTVCYRYSREEIRPSRFRYSSRKTFLQKKESEIQPGFIAGSSECQVDVVWSMATRPGFEHQASYTLAIATMLPTSR